MKYLPSADLWLRPAHLLKLIFLLAVLSGLPGQASAASCGFIDNEDTLVDFGVRTASTRAPIPGVGLLRFSCTDSPLAISYTLQVSTGNSGSFSERQLRMGSRSLTYNLYTDPNFMTIWGDGSTGSGTGVITGVCAVGATCAEDVYGLIDAGQSPSAGQYTDQVVVTLVF